MLLDLALPEHSDLVYPERSSLRDPATQALAGQICVGPNLHAAQLLDQGKRWSVLSR